MVGSLQHFKHDPNGEMRRRQGKESRGHGMYYHRGNGIWSKYNETKDGHLYHSRTDVPKNQVNKYEEHNPHKADYRTHISGYQGVVEKHARLPHHKKKGFF